MVRCSPNDLNVDRCLVIPDIQHRAGLVDEIRQRHPDLPAVFLADYCNHYGDGPYEMLQTSAGFATALKKDQDCFLMGNHRFAYLAYELSVMWGHCPGWRIPSQTKEAGLGSRIDFEIVRGDACRRAPDCQFPGSGRGHPLLASDWSTVEKVSRGSIAPVAIRISQKFREHK